MYLVNESSKLEPVNRVYKIREKSQSLLDHPRTSLCIDYPVESCKISVILFGSMLPNLKGH